MDAKEARDSLWLAGVPLQNPEASFAEIYELIDIKSVKDKELLLNMATGLVDFRYLHDTVQNRNLIWLNKIALERPSVIFHLRVPLITILDDILISCQNTATLEAAHQLFRTLTADPKFAESEDSTDMLDEVLEGFGFGGLWRSCTFHVPNDLLRQCTNLTDRLIEVRNLISISE